MKLVTSKLMRELEQRADAKGILFAQMMERAGTLTSIAILDRVAPNAQRFLILVGPGNNGGDGLVCARALHDAGKQVSLYIWKRDLSAFDENFEACRSRGIEYYQANTEMSQLGELVLAADVIVDALLGTGVTRPIEGVLRQLLESVKTVLKEENPPGSIIHAQRPSPIPASKSKFVAAIDLPSGLNPDTGALDPATLPADLTVTFGFAKPGQVLYPGAAAVGELVIADIGIPREWALTIQFDLAVPEEIKGVLPLRSENSNKGTFGRALIVAGSKNYVGAAALAAEGATRVGAGLVTVAMPGALYSALAAKLTVTTFLPLGDAESSITREAIATIIENVPGYEALLIGCGIGRAPATIQSVKELIESSPKIPILLDADALFALSQIHDWWKNFRAPPILTPHPGEMSRLTNLSIPTIENSRWDVARNFSLEWNAIVVLKGAHTAIAAPDGRLCVLPFANPALATAGTGDVLAGAIVGFLAQGLTPFEAALVGAFVHGLAGEYVRQEIGSAGAIASDLSTRLPKAIRQIARR
jgi:NAD(P)H-hydrate epimerase